jgi:hypothetical protein
VQPGWKHLFKLTNNGQPERTACQSMLIVKVGRGRGRKVGNMRLDLGQYLAYCTHIEPTLGCHCRSHRFRKSFGMYGGDDGARTRDLCRDSKTETRN